MKVLSTANLRRIVRQGCYLGLLILTVASAAGQTTAEKLASADWFSRPLGAGVVWKYYQFDDLFGSRQSISCIEADLDTPGVRLELPFLNGRQKTSTMIKNQFPQAAAGVNSTFFSTGGHRTFLKVNGTKIPADDPWGGTWAYSGGLVFNRVTGAYGVIRQPASSPAGDGWWQNNTGTWTDAIVNGPVLLMNGSITSGQFPSGSHCNRNPRTMIGVKPGNVLLLVVADGRHPEAAGLTCGEMAELMLALGCTDATSYDGGGSSAMYGRGEPNNGILNYPSDNGGYDHDPADERSVANAVAVIANAATPFPFDARIVNVSVPSSIVSGQRAYAIITYRNIGTQTWNSSRVTVTTSRPMGRSSMFYDSETWESQGTAWRLSTGVQVLPGNTVNIYLPLRAPQVPAPQLISETFQLTLDGTRRFGPADNELRISSQVVPTAGTFMVEPRSGGQNTSWYSDTGMADTSISCTLGTPDIGMRYGSTYRSVAGSKSARWYPSFTAPGYYRVYVAWGDGGLRRSPITYKIHHSGGTTTLNLNQTTTANQWIQLGGLEFEFDLGQNQQGVEMTNENIDVSGNMYAGPVAFEFVATSTVSDWALY